MKTRTLFISLLVIGIASIFFVSCKKDEDVVVAKSEALTVASDDAIASDLYDDVLNETDQIVSEAESNNYDINLSKAGSLQGTRFVEIDHPDTLIFPKVITVTYTNYTVNGRTKNGKIYIAITKKMWRPQGVRTITLSNFTINDYKVEGTKVVTYKGFVSGKPTIEVKLNNGKITSPDSMHFIERSFTRTKTWESGILTPLNVWDDVWFVTGNATGKSANGLSYTVDIKEPLVFKTLCPWISEGVIEITIAKSKKISIDFGTGTCDKSFTVSIDGESSTENSLDGVQTVD
jgi:hypothetical protein